MAVELVRVPIAPDDVLVVEAFQTLHEGYAAMLARFRERFSEAARAIAAAEPAVVVHCAVGRDRTGLLVALLLRLCGLELETIAADHAESDANLEETLAAWFDAAPDDAERERRQRIAAPAGDTVARVLEKLEREHGSVRAYLGLDEGTATRIRELLVQH